MTTNDQQITPADAAIVSSGTGTKGPEERDLPASLKEEMDLCLQILREVLGEFDEQLLASFDEVRGYALNASAERFAGILTDTNPDQDDLQNVVNTVDKLDMHDAQLLARAFATYFHLANLCEENYRVSVLHKRETAVDENQAVDPVNEMTGAYHQLINELGPAKARDLLDKLEFHPVFTAHPTEARRKAVEGKIRRISRLLEAHKLLGGSDKKENSRRLFNEIDALFRTSPIALRKRIRFSTSSTTRCSIPFPRSTVVSTIGCLATRPAWFRRCARRSSIREAGSVPTATATRMSPPR